MNKKDIANTSKNKKNSSKLSDKQKLILLEAGRLGAVGANTALFLKVLKKEKVIIQNLIRNY